MSFGLAADIIGEQDQKVLGTETERIIMTNDLNQTEPEVKEPVLISLTSMTWACEESPDSKHHASISENVEPAEPRVCIYCDHGLYY